MTRHLGLTVSALILLSLLFSCGRIGKIEKRLITDSKDSIWLLKGTGADTSVRFGHWQLSRNGRANFFMSIDDNIPSAQVKGVEGEIQYTWKFNQQDSTLKLGSNASFKIIGLNEDTILMTAQRNGKKFLLIRKYYKPNP